MNVRRFFVATLPVLVMFAACEEDRRGGSDSPSLCEELCSCEQCDQTAEDACRAEQDALQAQAEAANCTAELDDFVDCAAENNQCLNGQFQVSADCGAAQSTYLACLGGGPCPSAGDGVCDEPEGTGLCAEGTDPADCGGGGCPTTNDGICDEPEGTGSCPEGTDVVDCGGGGCPTTNNGVCDEPEGTGTCPEGTDAVDCSGPVTCDSLGDCVACQQCATDPGGPCNDELVACQNDVNCSQLAICIGDCDTQCGADQACFDTCVNGVGGCAETYQAGIPGYNALVDCAVVQECSLSCGA
jgi:hypothetical protein